MATARDGTGRHRSCRPRSRSGAAPASPSLPAQNSRPAAVPGAHRQAAPAAASTKATIGRVLLLPALSFTVRFHDARPQPPALKVAVVPEIVTVPLTTLPEL